MDARGRTLVLGGTGKTGRRVVERLSARGLAFRAVSRRTDPPFDWAQPAMWEPALRGVTAVYLAYAPDLAVPGAAEAIESFVGFARDHGVRKVVLLSGRGEEEAQRCEQIVAGSGMAWTVVRASWFAQNFSENFLLDLVLAGEVALPVGDVGEPFIDADDIADVAVAALTQDGHAGRVYEVTGPRLLTFADAVAEIAGARGRPIRYLQLAPEEFTAALRAQGVAAEEVCLLGYLFGTVMDGRNAFVSDGVRCALGREPRDFRDFARRVAETGVWSTAGANRVA